MAYKGKTGLRVILSHQYFNQFEDKYVLDAIKQLPKIKVMFDTPSYQDRLEMVKLLGYGGDIPHEAATYANKSIPKQEMVIAVGNDSPKRIKVPDVPDVKIDNETREQFIKEILTQEWCFSPSDIRAQMNKRFKYEPAPETKPDNKPAQHRAETDGKPSSSTGVSDTGLNLDKWKTISKDVSIGKQHAPKDGKKKGNKNPRD